MLTLGIETSCDETAAAVVKGGTKILSSVVSSSEEIHKKYGGIVPEQAAREQIKCIIPIIQEALTKSCGWEMRSESRMKSEMWEKIDAIAVTIGPGLIGSLLIGVETAKTLSLVWNKPIVPVNHLIAHIYANYIGKNPKSEIRNPKLPALCLVVSGGHTELVLMKNHGNFKWIGGTRDDAAGECFDKCARILGLGYPGGPAIEEAALKSALKRTVLAKKQGQSLIKKLPRPMINEDNFDFSFSGLKTSLLRKVESLKLESPKLLYFSRGHCSNIVKCLASELQEAITDCLVKKTLKAAEKNKVKSILVGGGVAANSRLREKFNEAMPPCLRQAAMKLFFPKKELCTDNAASIAAAAFFNYKPIPWSKVKPNPSLEIV